jgi:H+/gluconate symporter-like permease
MDQGLAVVIGMSVAYIASFAGMLFAYLSYRKRKKQSEHKNDKGL